MDMLSVILIVINALAVGIIGTIAVQHGVAYFKKGDERKNNVAAPRMTADMRQELLAEAEEKFRQEISAAASQLHDDISTTTGDLSSHVTKVGGEIISLEMQRYRDALDALRRQTEQIIQQAQLSVSQHQTEFMNRSTDLRTELDEKLRADVEASKQQILSQLDTKVADAVTSFLIDTLQHNVDLGAQADYMLATLEEHKDEIINEVKQ